MYNESFPFLLVPAKGNYDPSILISLEELIVKEEACVLTLTDSSMLIQYKGHLPSNSSFLHKVKISLLDDGSRAKTISNEFEDEKASLVVELGEGELFHPLHLGSQVAEGVVLLSLADQPIQIDVRSERSHILPIIVVCVDLKDLHLQIRDVFDGHIKDNVLTDLEVLPVVMDQLNGGVTLQVLYMATHGFKLLFILLLRKVPPLVEVELSL